MTEKSQQQLAAEQPRADKGQIDLWVSEIVELISKSTPIKEITKIMVERTGKAPDTCRKYYTLALKELKAEYSDKTDDVRRMKIAGLEADMIEAYKNYKASTDIKWFDMYIKIKQQLDKYQPDELRPKTEQDTQTINITYKAVGDSSDE